MKNLETSDWLVINNIIYKIYTTEDIMIMRSNLLEQLTMILNFDSADFFLADEDGKKGLINPVSFNCELDRAAQYDEKRGSNLLETLELYVRYDTSIQMVAEKTFTHRNTVNYRVKKIKELLDDDINTMEAKYKLQTAFYIKNYLQLKAGEIVNEKSRNK